MTRLVTRGPRWVPFPVDLVLIAAYTVVAAVGVTTLGGPVRTVLGLPLVAFVPGYVLLGMLFPRRSDGGNGSNSRFRPGRSTDRREPTWGERLGLAVPVSLALVALLALAVGSVASEIGVREVMTALVAASLVGSVVAGARRLAVPPTDRLQLPPVRRGPWSIRGTSRLDALVTLVLVLCVVGAASAMAYSVASPERGAAYTEFALLAENESGELVAGDYPKAFDRGESRRLAAAVTNLEGRSVEYTIVVEVQRVEVGATGSTVVENAELVRESRTVEPGATWQHHHDVAPSIAGEDLRLAYYLYSGAAPDDPDAETAYRHLHLWIDVEDEGEAANATASAAPNAGFDGSNAGFGFDESNAGFGFDGST